jgi:hypothetical protein
MRLFLFSASVFYLLGLKLTSQMEIKSSLSAKPSTIELKTFPEIKHTVQPLELKPVLLKKDTTISAETKNIRQALPSAKTQKGNNLPQS